MYKHSAKLTHNIFVYSLQVFFGKLCIKLLLAFRFLVLQEIDLKIAQASRNNGAAWVNAKTKNLVNLPIVSRSKHLIIKGKCNNHSCCNTNTRKGHALCLMQHTSIHLSFCNEDQALFLWLKITAVKANFLLLQY